MKIIELLKGKKTYVVGAIGVIYFVLISTGVLPDNPHVWAILGSAGLMFLRAGVAKLSNDTKQP